MSIRNERREAAIECMADHLLDKGMAAATLRPLAAAAGTSDRMLLYYFADRDELVTATLERVTTRLTVMLDQAFPAGTRLPFDDLLITTWKMVGSADLQPYMRLWLELAAGAARSQQPHRAIAASIIDKFAGWTTAHLRIDNAKEQETLPALLLVTIEGALVLDSAGMRDMADAAITSAALQYGR